MRRKRIINGQTHISTDIKHNELLAESHINGEVQLSLRISKRIILSLELSESSWLLWEDLGFLTQKLIICDTCKSFC